nr:MAG TPA: Protein of unknown function (DUF1366) [Caudoviricetes sp.]
MLLHHMKKKWKENKMAESFKIRSHYPTYDQNGNIKNTVFELYTASPTNLITVILDGDNRIQNPIEEPDYINKCMRQFHKTYFAEWEVQETAKKVDALETSIRTSQEENKRRDDFIEAMVLNTIMSDNVHYGVVYKKLAALLPKLQVGKTYERNEIATFLDESHTEVAEEGKLVIVQFNQEMVYNGEPLSSFMNDGEWGQNGKAIAWPFKIS